MAQPITSNNFSLLCQNSPEGYYLIGGKCRSCNEIVFPKPTICPRCTGKEIEETPLSRKGTLFTYTKVFQKPPDYSGTLPYIIGRILLPEGVFILSQLEAEFEDLSIGQEMQLAVKNIYRDDSGNEVIGYIFKPVSSGYRISI